VVPPKADFEYPKAPCVSVLLIRQSCFSRVEAPRNYILVSGETLHRGAIKNGPTIAVPKLLRIFAMVKRDMSTQIFPWISVGRP
jgi:hypothetical protein